MRPDRLGADQLAQVASVVGGAGLDPHDRTSLLQWAALGLTDLCWRHTTWVGRWHADRGGPLDAAAQLQAEVATARRFRAALGRAAAAGHPAGSREESSALAQAFTEALAEVFDPARRLPGGIALGEVAGDGLAALRVYAELQVLSALAVAERSTLDVALLVLAVPSRRGRSARWGTPDWPAVVDVLLRRLDDPHAELWAHPGGLPVPAEVGDRARLRRLLVEAPDELEPATVRFLLDALDLGSLTVDG